MKALNTFKINVRGLVEGVNKVCYTSLPFCLVSGLIRKCIVRFCECRIFQILTHCSFAQYKNVNISKTKEDIPKRKRHSLLF